MLIHKASKASGVTLSSFHKWTPLAWGPGCPVQTEAALAAPRGASMTWVGGGGPGVEESEQGGAHGLGVSLSYLEAKRNVAMSLEARSRGPEVPRLPIVWT